MGLTSKEKKELIVAFSKVIVNFKGHPKYPAVLLDMMIMHSDKSNDYATDQDPFANLELCEKVGFPAWKGIIIRLGDKYSRLLNALGGKFFKFEGIRDAFLDNACYSIIGIIEYEKDMKEFGLMKGDKVKERDEKEEDTKA